MKKVKVIQMLVPVGLGLGILVLLLIGIGMLPGKIEGVYRGGGIDCMCGSVNFMHFRDDKVMIYRSNHPPAELIGRYERTPDGTIKVFMTPSEAGKSEELIFRATPRLWFTRFEGLDGENGEWLRKHSISGTIETTMRDHEIMSFIIHEDRTVVKTFYDSALEEIRVETIEPKRPPEELEAVGEGE